MEKVIKFETVVEQLNPNDGAVKLSAHDIANKFFDRDDSYARTLGVYSEELWEDRKSKCQTYILNGLGLKYLVYDFLYVLNVELDEDGEIEDIFGIEDYFVKPIDETY